LEGAPDLAVKVASPRDDPDDLVLKAQQYLTAGARAVWIIYPEKPASLISISPASVPRFVMQASPSMMPNSFLAFLRHCPRSWDNEGTLSASVARAVAPA